MDRKEFITQTVGGLTQEAFVSLRNILLDDSFIPLGMTQAEKMDWGCFEEKLYDHFEKVELTSGRSFERLAQAYIEALDAVVAPRVAQSHQSIKDDETVIMIPLARKYYNETVSAVNVEKPDMQQLTEYTRRMMCLYTAYLNNRGKEIYNLEDDASVLSAEKLMSALAKEKVTGFSGKKKNRFNLKVRFSVDRCIFIMAYMLIYSVIDRS